jgi:hypothetical protein
MNQEFKINLVLKVMDTYQANTYAPTVRAQLITAVEFFYLNGCERALHAKAEKGGQSPVHLTIKDEMCRHRRF